MTIEITITTLGRAAIVNAEHTGTAPVTIAEIGVSATAVTPAAGITSLSGEIKRLSGASGSVVAADTIHVGAIDGSTDVYTVRSFALYLADGTLFAIYGQSTPILEKVAASAAALSIDVIFADIAATSLTFGNTNFVNPPATTTVQGIVELATNAEAIAGTDTVRALVPAAGRAALLPWLLGLDGSGSGLDADLLDGQDGSYYANVAARLGFAPLAASTYTAADILAKLITVDGSGSGLDADLLDGQNSSAFALASANTTSNNANGYCFNIKIGAITLKLQVGQVRSGTSSGGSTSITFPEAFAAAPLGLFFSIYDSFNSYSQVHLVQSSASATGATFRAVNDDSGSGTVPGFDWIAIGI